MEMASLRSGMRDGGSTKSVRIAEAGSEEGGTASGSQKADEGGTPGEETKLIPDLGKTPGEAEAEVTLSIIEDESDEPEEDD